MAGLLTNLQDNYSQLMPYDILEREGIVRKIIYNPHDPIATMFSSVEELIEFADIMGTVYTQIQAVNISYEYSTGRASSGRRFVSGIA